MLTVDKLSVKAGEQLILDEVSLTIPAGETHILMGPNGSGKSTLLRAIMGLGDLEVISGRIIFQGRDVTKLSVDERARLGMGIAMQHSPSLPEVTLEGLAQVLGDRYRNDWRPLATALNCGYLLERGLNDRFSGGESKRAELFQLLIQRPQLLLVDEPESGVDLVNIAVVGKALHQLLKPGKIKHREHSGLIITHTGHILNYLNADQGYVLINGKLVCEGNPRDLFDEVSKHGFEGCVACAECKRR